MITTIAYQKQADADRYDSARTLPSESMTIWMERIKAAVGDASLTRILDLGCGTGRFTMPLAQTFGAEVVGVEPSPAMLDVAARQNAPDVEWKLGAADRIPLEDNSVGMVFMSQVYHHLPSPEDALAEISRVLRANGLLVIRNATHESNRRVLWMQCIPEGAAIDDGRMLPQAKLVEQVSARHFEWLSTDSISTLFSNSYTEYCDKIGARGLSALIQISDEAFVRGMEQLRAYASQFPDTTPIYEAVDLFVFRHRAKTSHRA